MLKFCSFCDLRTEVRLCECGHSATLGCSSKNACPTCEKAHRTTFGPFFRGLLSARPATRSNSPRTRLLGILHETIVNRRTAIPRSGYALSQLRETSPFDENAENFRARILNVADSLRLNQDVAKTLTEKCVEASITRAIEKLDDCVRANVQHGKEVAVVANFLNLITPMAR